MRRSLKRTVTCILISLLILAVHVLWTSHIRDNSRVSTSKSYFERDYVLSEDTQKSLIVTNQTKPNLRRNKVNIYKRTLSANRIIHLQKTYLKTTKRKTPIYVYSSKVDSMISAHLKSYGTWEEDLLNQTGHYLKQYSDITFLDIGCNIGVYTLFIADLGIKVISVDPLANNLILLSKSVLAGNLEENVTLVLNAASDEYKTVNIDIPKGNVGGAHIVNNVKLQNNVHTTETILLDDLIPYIGTNKVFIKMDVEGHEWHALKGGYQLFQTKNVKVILMEWVHHKHTENGQLIIDKLMKNGFLPYMDSAETHLLEPHYYYLWPENVFWIKR